MKVQKEFAPVSITFESKKELDGFIKVLLLAQESRDKRFYMNLNRAADEVDLFIKELYMKIT